jgi:hypothetical protein
MIETVRWKQNLVVSKKGFISLPLNNQEGNHLVAKKLQTVLSFQNYSRVRFRWNGEITHLMAEAKSGVFQHFTHGRHAGAGISPHLRGHVV